MKCDPDSLARALLAWSEPILRTRHLHITSRMIYADTRPRCHIQAKSPAQD